MYKVLLVDDDYPVLELLSEEIDWNHLGLALSGAYENGLEALAAAEREMPDIVITDIGMPKMDGLELIERLKERKANLKAVILSCHSEFHYAKRALKLQVQDYIVKDTLNPRDLEQILLQFTSGLDAERQSHLEQHRLRHLEDRSREAIKEQWIRHAIQQPILQAHTWQAELESFGLPLQDRHLLPLIGTIDHYSEVRQRFISEDSLRFAVTNVLEEVVQDVACEAVVFPYSSKEWYIMLSIRPTLAVNGYEEARKLLECIRRALSRSLKLSMSVVIGRMCSSPEQLKPVLRDLLAGDAQRFYMEPGAVEMRASSKLTEEDLYAYYHEASEQIYESVMKRDASEVRERTEEWMAFIRSSRFLPETVKDWTLKLLLDLRLKHQSLHYFRTTRSAKSLHQDIAEIHQLTELQEWLNEQLISTISVTEDKTVRTLREEVLQAYQYVALRLDQRISLEEMADHLHLNASYFSRLFKKETGETFIEYVIRTKMEHAKKLLDQTAQPISRICEMLGYDNPSYFIKLFKNYTGVTPIEYRNRGAISQ